MATPSNAPPVVDFAATPAAQITAVVHQACTETGFFVVTGHGLNRELDDLFDAAHRFFAQPQVDKEATPRVDRYGFVPQAVQALDQNRLGGITEYLDVGLADEIPLPPIAGFEAAVRSYQTAALAFADTLLAILCEALTIDRTFFADRMTDPQCRLRLLHYPPFELQDDGIVPITTTPHTDYGLITLLATDGVPGLEVKPIGGEWTSVVAPAGSLVVNLGDMLARWTNDRYRSTPHRVVGPVDGDRFSIPFFINPDPQTVVECIPSCVTTDRPCGYPPVTATDFLAMRIDNRTEPYVDPTEGPARHKAIFS